MALPGQKGDREFQKFVDDGSGNTAVRAVLSAGTVSGNLTVSGDLTVTGDFAFSGVAANQLFLGDDDPLTFGNTSASPDVQMLWETADADAHYFNIAIGSASRNIIISEDTGIDWGHAASTDPKLWIHSADGTDTSDYINFSHNQTDAVIDWGNGKLQFAGTGNSRFVGPVEIEVDNGFAFNVSTSAAESLFYVDTNSVDISMNAATVIALPAQTSGVKSALVVQNVGDTGMTAATEAPVVSYDFSAGRAWAAGAGPLATQRDFLITASTLDGDAGDPLTITQAATFAITGAPTAGANMTLTNAYALWVQDGITQLDALRISSDVNNSVTLSNGLADETVTGLIIDKTNTTSNSNNRIVAFASNGSVHSYVRADVGSWHFGGSGASSSTLNIGIGNLGGTLAFTGSNSGKFATFTLKSGIDFSLNDTGAAAPKGYVFKGMASTALTASTEYSFVDFDLDETYTWATGALTTQRHIRFRNPTYAFAGASTLSGASTISIDGAPLGGSNASITMAAALEMQSWSADAGSNYNISVTVPGIATSIGAVTQLSGIRVGGGFGNTSLGDQTATLTSLYQVFIDEVTYDSTTNTRTVTNAAGLVVNAPAAGTNVTFTNREKAIHAFGDLVVEGRVQGDKGSDVASADEITLGDGNFFDVTGTTTINHITKTGWEAGSVVTLQFDASVTVTHNAGSPTGTEADILLSGAGNFSATADDTLTLVYDGVTWREIARTVI